MADGSQPGADGGSAGTVVKDKPWFEGYADDGKALRFTPDELKGVPENLKPRLERLGTELGRLEEAAKPKTPQEYKLTMPEKSLLDAKRIQDVADFAKKNGLTQEAAQAILEREHGTLDAYSKSKDKEWADKAEGWQKAAKEDKEIGGDKLAENVALADKVINKFGSPELKAMLSETKLSGHPEILRVFVKMGRLMSDDQFVTGGEGKPPAQKSATDKLYGKVD